MNIKNILLYLFIIPGIIFSLLLLFASSFLSTWVIIGISLLIGVLIFFGTSIKSIINYFSISSLTSRVPNIKTTIVVLFVIAIIAVTIILVFYQLPKSINYAENRNQERFDDNEYRKDYVYYFDINKGQISIEEERLLVFGTISIINTDVSYPNPKLGFDILVAEGKTAFVEIIFRDVDITTETSLNFTVEHYYVWQTIEFGVDSQNQIWAKAFGRDPQNLQKSPCSYIDTSKPFNVIVKITGDKMENRCAVNIDNVGLGA